MSSQRRKWWQWRTSEQPVFVGDRILAFAQRYDPVLAEQIRPECECGEEEFAFEVLLGSLRNQGVILPAEDLEVMRDIACTLGMSDRLDVPNAPSHDLLDKRKENMMTDIHAEHTLEEHTHGEGCGHEAVAHGDHIDYVHNGHHHALHGDHYDEHGDVAEHTRAEHEHGDNCGHEAVPHDDHVDYIHDGHRHAAHGEHYDEH